MRRSSRAGRCLKWFGLLACVATLAAWAVSTCWYYSRITPYGFQFALRYGCVSVVVGLPRGIRAHPTKRTYRRSVSSLTSLDDFGLFLPSVSDPNWPGFSLLKQIVIPLWVVLLTLGVPTAVLWWRDRRPYPPGYCQKCGYNLTGNVSGRCPECGTPISRLAAANGERE